MEGLVEEIPQHEKINLGGDINGHIEKKVGKHAWFYDGFGIRELNEEEKSIFDFSVAYDFNIANTYFKNQKEHLIAYKSGVSTSQIDVSLVRSMDKRIFKDCKVILGELDHKT